ncbi:Yip1 family protein [Litoreibacter janthinus]|uniref:Yip1 domain-containing protein n=1 Tax=Litoreibacter janthinus TaxID=670154 RepID=A0A1I6H2M2_9RHOB|nr:Yip1 family protein [Litoreibacter janthinus]SFR48652.1 Yip1 domain-containing protein [Litoreibacter janthinus]
MLAVLLQLVGETLRRPSQAAETVLNFKLERGTLWLTLALVSIVSVLFNALTMAFVPPEMVANQGALPTSPFLLVLVIWGLLVLSVFFTHYISRAFDGAGTLDGSLITVIWMQIVLLVLQVFQIALFIIAPIVAVLFGWVAAAYVFYVFLQFVRVLHGFRSLGLVLAGAIVAILGLSVGIAAAIGMIAALFGLELGANV